MGDVAGQLHDHLSALLSEAKHDCSAVVLPTWQLPGCATQRQMLVGEVSFLV